MLDVGRIALTLGRKLRGYTSCPACGELTLRREYDNPIRGNSPDPGWELFSRWSCDSCDCCTEWEFFGVMRDVARTLGVSDAALFRRCLLAEMSRRNVNNRGGVT